MSVETEEPHYLATMLDLATCPKGEVWRMRLERDPDYGLATLADEQVSSGKPTAQVLTATTIELTRAEAVWLRERLGELLAVWEE